MKKLLPLLVWIAALCAPMPTSATASYDHWQADPAARQGLKTLQQLAASNPKSVSDYKVRSTEDFKRAVLGAPFPMYFLHVELLSGYTADKNPKDFLYGLHFIYPVTIDGRIIASMKITQGSDGHWRMAALEDGPKAITEITRAAGALKVDDSHPDAFGIEDGGETVFVGIFRGDDITLLPFNDEAQLGLKTGLRVSARELFLRFREEVQKADKKEHDFK